MSDSKTLYQVHTGSEELGPFTLTQLRSMWKAGQFTADSNCRVAGRDQWFPLMRVAERQPFFTRLRIVGLTLIAGVVALYGLAFWQNNTREMAVAATLERFPNEYVFPDDPLALRFRAYVLERMAESIVRNAPFMGGNVRPVHRLAAQAVSLAKDMVATADELGVPAEGVDVDDAQRKAIEQKASPTSDFMYPLREKRVELIRAQNELLKQLKQR